jgi:dTDP-3-amino-3,4,6-trideoxy-alpha-D-glucose transaminase
VTTARIPFGNLTLGEDEASVRAAIDRVLRSGWFILGAELEAFEAEFARASQAKHAVGVGNGTDALALIIRALGIGTGDEVIVPAMTAGYTGIAVMMAGATPVIVDVDPATLTIDPAALNAAITGRTAAVIPVHLYGASAKMEAIADVARRHRLAIVEDCCQAHLGSHGGLPVGTIGTAGAFSFYPTKNLGGLGDGGAVITNDAALADRVRRFRNGGQLNRYDHADAGVNSRLDEIQAAVLRARLPLLAAWTTRRVELAERYREALPPGWPLPDAPGHVYHLFPVRTMHRDALQVHLGAAGIETLIHYPVALTHQPAFAPFRPAPAPTAERAARELLSLPLYPRLRDADVARIADAVGEFQKGRAFA